jgi:hypothetical protein
MMQAADLYMYGHFVVAVPGHDVGASAIKWNVNGREQKGGTAEGEKQRHNPHYAAEVY